MMLNKIHHIDNRAGMAKLHEKCASLIIADPPYFEVKGEFDFVWKSFDEYLDFMEAQAKAYKRILAENGTLYVYGDSKNIAYVQVIFDKYFGLINNLVWEKSESGGLFGSSASEQMRSYAKSTERLLMYVLPSEPSKTNFKPVMDYIMEQRIKCGFNYLQMDSYLGIKASSCFWDKETSHEYVIPTEEHWLKLQKTGFFRREYEDLRRPFTNYTESTEVLKFRFEGCDHDHDTVKPDSISNCLVITSSRKGDLVVIPFAGSGSECVAAKKKGRDFIGFETELKYVEMATERVRLETRQISMF